MMVYLAWAALRRHPFSVVCTALLAIVSASLRGTPVPLALGLWAATSLFSVTIWYTVEPFILRRFGCRRPSPRERECLDPPLGGSHVEIVVLEAPQTWLCL